MRAVLGWLLVLVGGAVAVLGSWRPWWTGRSGEGIPLEELVTAPGSGQAFVLWSLALPVLVGVVLAVLGLVRTSRAVIALGGVLAALPVVLPLALRHIAVGDVEQGAWNVACGAALILAAAIVGES